MNPHIIHVAEPRRVALLGVVQPSSPIDGYICRSGIEAFSRGYDIRGLQRVA